MAPLILSAKLEDILFVQSWIIADIYNDELDCTVKLQQYKIKYLPRIEQRGPIPLPLV